MSEINWQKAKTLNIPSYARKDSSMFSVVEGGVEYKWRDQDLWEEALNCYWGTFDIKSLKGYEVVEGLINDFGRIQEADVDYPIIITPDNWIADGYHRAAKSLLLGQKKIIGIQLKKMPEPYKK